MHLSSERTQRTAVWNTLAPCCRASVWALRLPGAEPLVDLGEGIPEVVDVRREVMDGEHTDEGHEEVPAALLRVGQPEQDGKEEDHQQSIACATRKPGCYPRQSVRDRRCSAHSLCGAYQDALN